MVETPYYIFCVNILFKCFFYFNKIDSLLFLYLIAYFITMTTEQEQKEYWLKLHREQDHCFGLVDGQFLDDFEDLVNKTNKDWKNQTKDEDLKIGDIIKYCVCDAIKHYRLVQVVKLSEKSIWYKYCDTKSFELRDNGGDTHTFGLYCGGFFDDEKGFRKKRDTKPCDNYNDEKWRGNHVYNKTRMIWLKEEETDIWR